MKGQVSVYQINQEEAEAWVQKQGDTIYNISYEDEIQTDLRGDELKCGIRIFFSEYQRERIEYFPQDNYGMRGRFNRETY